MVVSSGDTKETSAGKTRSAAVIALFNSNVDISAIRFSGTSVGKHSISMVLVAWVISPPSLAPIDSPSNTIGIETVIFSSRRTRIKSTCITSSVTG